MQIPFTSLRPARLVLGEVPARPALVLAGAIAVVMGAGVLRWFDLVTVGPAFNLDGEGTVPAKLSALVLIGAAVAAGRVRDHGSARRSLAVIAALFAFMALDEVAAIHERLEIWLATDWQVVYVPLGLAAVAAWAGCVRALTPTGVALWLGGAAAWAVAALLEAIQWGAGDVLVHPRLVPPEELLEVIGSALWLLALAARNAVARRP
jgi:hypothetical protein